VLEFVRDVEELLEEKEELPVTLGLELFQPSVHEINQGLKKLFVALAEMRQEVEELIHLQLGPYLLKYLIDLILVEPNILFLQFRDVALEINFQLFCPLNGKVYDSPYIPVFIVKAQLLGLVSLGSLN
jgi:hypothetical protein